MNGTATRIARLREDGRWRLAVEASVALALASVAVRLVPDSRTARLLGTPVPAQAGEHPRAPAARAEAQRVGRAVAGVARVLPWRPVCLPQAIATRAMLRRRSIPATCHLGMLPGTPRAAHAWVSVDGVVVQGGPLRDITELARLR